MNIRPAGDNVFLQDEMKDRVSPGGIILPDTAGSQWGKGVIACRVLRAGPGGWGDEQAYEEQEKILRERMELPSINYWERDKIRGQIKDMKKRRFYPVDVKEGDLVLVDKLAGQTAIVGDDLPAQSAITLEAGQEIRIVRNEEILCVVEEEK